MTLAAGLLANLPLSLRTELFGALETIERNFRESRWEPSELNGGKLCEIAYTIIRGHVDGSFPPNASKPANMVAACQALEQASGFPRSLRIQIPRMIMALYEVRNNRGVGHVGGDVSPNHMDASCVLQMAKWIVSELIRVFHNVSTAEASAAVDALSDREISLVWAVNGTRRVLDTGLSMLQKSLLLLYGSSEAMSESELASAVEHSNSSVYRRDVIRPAHKKKLLEYDETARMIYISPKGSKMVEDLIAIRP